MTLRFPFRLTPQIQHLMLPFVRHGPVRETMIRALECIRADSSVLMAALGVFVREPTVDWLDLAKRQARKLGMRMQKLQNLFIHFNGMNWMRELKKI